MASIKHREVTGRTITKSDWDANHEITGTPNKLLGLDGQGKLTEFPIGAGGGGGGSTVFANLKGTLGNEAQLPASGNLPGDAYIIGTNLYVYNGTTFNNVGPFVGPKGDKGDKGDTGNTGPQGVPGIQGPRGPQGNTGSIGPKGDKGDKGDTGAVGPVGPVGPAGPKGDQGTPGVNGNTIITGTVDPATNVGNIGDYYINKGGTTWYIFGPKTGSGWGTGTALIGGGSGGGSTAEPVAKTTDPYIQINGGSVQVGNQAMLNNGTYTGNPAPTITWVWQRETAVGSGSYVNIPDTENDVYYIFQTADVDLRIRVVETAANAQNSVITNTGTLGPVAAAPPTDVITPPVVSAGTNPGEWNAQIVDDTSGVGDQWVLQVDAANDFVQPLIYEGRRIIQPNEFEGTSFGDWSGDAVVQPVPGPYSAPAGQSYLRMGIERYTESGTVFSGWSNILSQNIQTVVGALVDQTGSFKHSLVDVSPDKRTGTLNQHSGQHVMVRSVQKASGKRHMEFLCNRGTTGVSTQQEVGCGIMDSDFVIGPNVYPSVPGDDSSIKGFAGYIGDGFWGMKINGNWLGGTGSVNTGDVLIFEYDTDAGTVSQWLWRASDQSITANPANPATIPPALRPTDWHLFVGGRSTGDSCTVNFGQDPFKRALSTDYLPFGQG